MSFLNGIIERLFSRAIAKRVDLAVRALDDKRDWSYRATTHPRDRYAYDRDEVLADALEAWRVNPLARRIVGMTTEYVVGGGIKVESKHKGTNKFLNAWWNHPLNRLAGRICEWCDELTRTGDLFLLISTDAAGMSYVRAIPSAEVQDIETAENDLSQELYVIEKPTFSPSTNPSTTASLRSASAQGGPASTQGAQVGSGFLEGGRRWRAYDANTDNPDEAGVFEPVCLHYAVNRPVGAKFGESDLAPMLRWLTRYAAWLEDRARLNRYRNTFIFWVRAKFTSQAEKLERQAQLNMNPPNPGSILVSDESETWDVLSPKLESHEAAEDGLALKKMIAIGAGFPLHFLAEPESATRTTAEASGGPTFRHLQQRQEFVLWMVEDIARTVVRRRQFYDRRVNPEAPITATGADISARDNSALARSAAIVVDAFGNLRDRGLIDDAEFLRVVYRFSGEPVDIEELLMRGAAAPPTGREPEETGTGQGPITEEEPVEV